VTALQVAALFAALTVSTVLLVVVVAAVWWFDRYDREPLHLVAAVFLWGAIAAPVLAVTGGSALTAGLDLSATSLAGWVGPLLEEAAKAVGVILVVLLSREFDNPTDGLVYGTASGLGFAATENLAYTLAGAGGPALGPTLVLVLLRTAMAAGVHAVSSATFGGFLGFAYLSRNRAERVCWIIGGLIGAVAIHSGWNLMLLRLDAAGNPTPVTGWFVAVPALYFIYLAALYVFLRCEQRILGRELAEEVELEVVPEWVPKVIPFYRRRIRSEWWPSRRERTVLARLLTRLAFRKHAVKRLPEDEAQLAGLEVVRLRQRVRAMLDCQTSVEEDGPAA
jgi:RsiW-degrading membrane proteinase PrsW (M82 family)